MLVGSWALGLLSGCLLVPLLPVLTLFHRPSLPTVSWPVSLTARQQHARETFPLSDEGIFVFNKIQGTYKKHPPSIFVFNKNSPYSYGAASKESDTAQNPTT